MPSSQKSHLRPPFRRPPPSLLSRRHNKRQQESMPAHVLAHQEVRFFFPILFCCKIFIFGPFDPDCPTSHSGSNKYYDCLIWPGVCLGTDSKEIAIPWHFPPSRERCSSTLTTLHPRTINSIQSLSTFPPPPRVHHPTLSPRLPAGRPARRPLSCEAAHTPPATTNRNPGGDTLFTWACSNRLSARCSLAPVEAWKCEHQKSMLRPRANSPQPPPQDSPVFGGNLQLESQPCTRLHIDRPPRPRCLAAHRPHRATCSPTPIWLCTT